MKSKFSYKSKRTIIIAAIITVLLAGTATGVYFFTKGNAQAQAAGDNNTTQEQYGEAPEENKNEQQNNTTENEQNKNEQGETTPNQQEEQETERQEQTTNNNQTMQNEQTTTTTTGEVPNQEYVTEREETVKNPWESLEVGWGPTQFASIASTANLTARKSNLEIHKTVDKESVKIGDTLTYTISVKNNGDKVAKAIIYDNVPEGTVLLNKDNNEDENTKKLTWRVTVEPGETENVEFTVRVKAEKGTIKNSAIVNGKTTEETETGIINITGKKEVNTSEAKVGDTLTYTITLTNSGNADGTVTVTDEIPTGTRIKDENTTGYNKETNTMTWSNVEVKAGKSAKLALEVVVDDNISIIKNIAYVDGNKIPEEPETTVKHHYTVEHYTENLDGTYSKVDKDTVVSEDVEIGTKVSYEVKKYEGFEYDESQTVNKDATVPDNNNLVVKLYYTRNSYKVTYEYEGTVPAGASNLPEEATYKYGANVTVAEEATAPGYTFSGWDKEDFTMPAEDVVIKGSFTANTDTQYKVEHYLQDLDGNSYTLKDTETLAGTTDTTATATPKQYPGFTYDSTVEGTKTEGVITGDGQLVLKLYYVRATYTYTIHYFYNGVEDEGKQEGPFQAKFGEKVNSYRDKSEEGKYTQYDITSSNKTEEAILVIGTGENFINVYYGTPEVSINKDVSSKVANVGDTLDYTITVSENRKLVNARNIKVTDNLPSELDVIADSITSGGKLNDAKTEIEWNIAELEKGNNVELKFTARIKPNSIGKTISNTANLGGTTSGDSNTVTTTVSELKAAVKEVKKGTTGKDAVNIVLVMDLSYSMKSNKTSDGVTRLEAAKTAATKFINSIYTKDPKSKVTVTVLTFNSANPLTTIKYVGTERCTNNDILHLHWNCKNIDGVWYSKWEENTVEIPYSGTSKLGFADKSNYTSLVEEINEITLPNENPGPGLGTNVSAALDLTKTTVADLEENHSENSNVVILLSDGAPTTSYSGNSSWNNYEGLRNQASEIKGNPITTEFYSIQFGTEDGAYDLLRAMSSNNTVYTSNSINSLVENFTNILDQNTTKDPIDTVNGKYTTTLSNPLVVDADNLITVTYKGTTLFTCKSLPSNGLTYDSTTKTITWDINAWNAVEDHTKVTTNDIVIQCYVER